MFLSIVYSRWGEGEGRELARNVLWLPPYPAHRADLHPPPGPSTGSGTCALPPTKEALDAGSFDGGAGGSPTVASPSPMPSAAPAPAAAAATAAAAVAAVPFPKHRPIPRHGASNPPAVSAHPHPRPRPRPADSGGCFHFFFFLWQVFLRMAWYVCGFCLNSYQSIPRKRLCTANASKPLDEEKRSAWCTRSSAMLRNPFSLCAL